MEIKEAIKKAVRDIADFPVKGAPVSRPVPGRPHRPV